MGGFALPWKVNKKKEKITLPYFYAIGYILLLFITVPYVRNVQKFVYNNLGKKFFTFLVLGALAIGFTCVIFKLWRQGWKNGKFQNIIWLTTIGCIYAFFTLTLKKHPEEAIHFLEYGLLSYLLFNALKHHIKDVTIYVVASLIILIVGTADEIIQWIIPDRYWDLRDVGMNFFAGVLLQIAIWKGIHPEIISEKITQKSVKILSIVAACAVLVLSICIKYLPINSPASL